MGAENYNQDVINLEPARIIIDNEATIYMANVIKIQRETDMWLEGITMYNNEQLYRNINLNGLKQNNN